MQLIDFLKTVLPEKGQKCSVKINKDGKIYHYFSDTFEGLAAKLQEISNQGADAYFACATYREATVRRGTNALLCKSFWVDLDAGEGKPYENAEAALLSVDDFCNNHNFPLPLVVRSGRGLHCYWLLSEAIDATKWTGIARRFKAFAHLHGLHADPARTADVASILRAPGTYNFKHNPALVQAQDDEIETISADAFDALIGNLPHLTQVVKCGVLPPHLRGIQVQGSNAAVKGMHKQSVLPVAEGGRNNACTQHVGKFFGMGLSYDECLSQARLFNAQCQPPMDDAEVIGIVNSIARREAEKPVPIINLAENPKPAPRLPKGYSANPGGAMFATVAGHNEKGEETLKSYPIAAYECYLTDVCRKENENFESYVFDVFHPHNGWHSFLVKREEYDGPGWLGIMGKNCADIINPKLYKAYVQAAAIALKGEKMDSTRYEQMGWKNNFTEFLVGNTLYGQNGKMQYAYGDEKLEPRLKAMRLLPGTSLATWTAAANQMFAPGFEAHSFGIITAFGSILMPLLAGATDGGVVLALHSVGSGYGKTNTLQAIASVWGSYNSLALSGNDTSNAMFNKITSACNLPVYTEEMGKRDPAVETAFFKAYISGKEKDRSKRDGSVEYKNNRFCNIMITASNYSLADILRMGGDEGAQARIFEINMEMPEDKELFKNFSRIAAEMLKNYGWAGRAFVMALLKPGVMEYVVAALKAKLAEYENYFSSNSKDRYILFLLACDSVAAKLLNLAGILAFSEERIINWALKKADEHIKMPSGNDPVDVLNQFIAEHIMECLVVQGEFSPRQKMPILQHPKNRLSMRLDHATGILSIPHTVLKYWLNKNNHHADTLARALIKDKILIDKNRQVTLAAGTEYPCVRQRCWVINTANPAVSGKIAEAIKADVAYFASNPRSL